MIFLISLPLLTRLTRLGATRGLLPFGFGIHHTSMSCKDSWFARRHLTLTIPWISFYHTFPLCQAQTHMKTHPPTSPYLTTAPFPLAHFKMFLLFQAHFLHIQLPPDPTADQVHVLEKVLNLFSACVNVMSSNAWLNTLGAMDLSQMCAQAMWETN